MRDDDGTDPRVALFDLDGTLWDWGSPLPGAVEVLKYLRDDGWSVGVVTNNTFQTAEEIGRRLDEMGMRVDFVSGVVDVGARVAANLKPGGTVLGVGSSVLNDQLHHHGMRVVNAAPADVVVVGNDLGLSHESLSRALEALLNGAAYVALNLDPFYIGPHQRPRMGGGALVKALNYASRREPDILVGKPSPELILHALEHFGASPDRCVFVGDSLETDVQAASAAGTKSALVLTGVSAGLALPDIVGDCLVSPSIVAPNLTSLLAAFGEFEAAESEWCA